MANSDRRAFIGLAVFGALGVAIEGCKADTVSPGNGVVVPAAAQPQKQPVENAADTRHGKDLWSAIRERPESEQETRFPNFVVQAKHQYEEGRDRLNERLLAFNDEVIAAHKDNGPWIGGGGRDYVAGQAAIRINNAVDNFQTVTGLHFAPTPVEQNNHVGRGVDSLEMALSRAIAMTSQDHVPGHSMFLDADDKHQLDIEKAFTRSAFQLERILDKVDAVQERAGWTRVPHAAPNYSVPDDSSKLIRPFQANLLTPNT